MTHKFRSRKDTSAYLLTKGINTKNWTEEKWLSINKGQAEIHMMALAEAIWDALNESTPQVLRPGQWHIPYEDKILIEEVEKSIGLVPGGLSLETFNRIKIKISTAMCARESYTTLGDEKEFTIEKQIALHDKLVQSDPKHWSPTEHCAKAMTDDDWESYYRGAGANEDYYGREENHGWCRNFKGFIQYREILENEQR